MKNPDQIEIRISRSVMLKYFNDCGFNRRTWYEDRSSAMRKLGFITFGSRRYPGGKYKFKDNGAAVAFILKYS